MSRVQGLIDRHRLDSTVAWAGTSALAIATIRFLTGDEPDWAALTLLLVGVTVVPSLMARDPRVTLPGELLAVVALPVLVRAGGVFPEATPFLAIAGFALLTAILAEVYTTLRMTPRFIVVFTVITTMAFAGVWTVGIWTADSLFGTGYLTGKNELMWDLVTATATGIVAGVVFELYFVYTDRLDRLAERELREPEPGVSAPTGDRPEAGPYRRSATRGMQFLLGVIAAFALSRGNWTLLVNSAGPLAVTAVPGVLRREYGYPVHVGVVFWITLAATLHAVGALGPYQVFDWYDSVTHTLSGALVAGVGYAVARALELHSDDVAFGSGFRSVFVLVFVLAVGVGWEILEFASGGLASVVGGEPALAQYGAGDIAKDLLFDTVGGVAVAFWSTDRIDGIAHALTDRVGLLVRRR